jgi:hypothetical protein
VLGYLFEPVKQELEAQLRRYFADGGDAFFYHIQRLARQLFQAAQEVLLRLGELVVLGAVFRQKCFQLIEVFFPVVDLLSLLNQLVEEKLCFPV